MCGHGSFVFPSYALRSEGLTTFDRWNHYFYEFIVLNNVKFAKYNWLFALNIASRHVV